MGESRTLEPPELDSLIVELRARGFTVLGPTLRDGAIVNAPIAGIDDLPAGVGDEQAPAHYRTTARDDGAYFGFAAGAQSMKPVLFPADELLWRGRRDGTDFTVEPPPDPREDAGDGPPYALLGVRGCDLAAILVHDRVLAGRNYTDASYLARREEAFVVSVTCGSPADTCFCPSMGTGPAPREGYDLNLTEVIDDAGHRFVVDVGTERGAELLDAIGARAAEEADGDAAAAVVAAAEAAITRAMPMDGMKDALYAAAQSPRWEEIASRCLSCTNCTLVCPTCFCTTVEDVGDLAATDAERHRVWDSCFSEDFSHIHGGPVRPSGAARYRQWLTHKLGSWQDQFGTAGCVGCGRCVTWCPAGIDITVEAAALKAEAESTGSTAKSPGERSTS